jgi:hypothetical protein
VTRALLVISLALATAGCKKDKSEEKVVEEPADPVPSGAAPSGPEAESDATAAAPTATTPSPEEQALAAKAAGVMEELGKIAEGAKGNCDKAAKAMKAVIDENKDTLAGAAKVGEDPAKEAWLENEYGPRMEAAQSKLMPLMEKCAEHEGVATVFDAIE